MKKILVGAMVGLTLIGGVIAKANNSKIEPVKETKTTTQETIITEPIVNETYTDIKGDTIYKLWNGNIITFNEEKNVYEFGEITDNYHHSLDSKEDLEKVVNKHIKENYKATPIVKETSKEKGIETYKLWNDNIVTIDRNKNTYDFGAITENYHYSVSNENTLKELVQEHVIKNEKSLPIVTEKFTNSMNQQIIRLWDDSFIAINKDKNLYEFTPVNLGDWNYTLNSIDELTKIVETYVAINYYNNY